MKFSEPWGRPHYAFKPPPRCRLCQASAGQGTTHYMVLGLTATATQAEIKRAYRQAALQLHPDVNKEDTAVARFTRCNEAYEVLSDAAKKRAYDAQLRARTASSPFSTSGSAASVWDFMNDVGMGPRTSGRTPGGFEHDDDDDEDDVDVQDLVEEFEYEFWASTGSNFRSSFTSSFSGATGRKKREAAEARAARAGSAGGAGKAASRSKRDRGTPTMDADELLDSLGDEARRTAQGTFGQRLEKLQSVQELLDFFEVLTTLRDDMGISFELFSSPAAHETYRRTSSASTRSGGRAAASGKKRATAKRTASPSPTSDSPSGSRVKTGAGRAATASRHGPFPKDGKQAAPRNKSPEDEDPFMSKPRAGASKRSGPAAKQQPAASKQQRMPSWSDGDELETDGVGNEDGWYDAWAGSSAKGKQGRSSGRHTVEVVEHGTPRARGKAGPVRPVGGPSGPIGGGPFADLFGGDDTDDDDDDMWEALFEVGEWDTRGQAKPKGRRT